MKELISVISLWIHLVAAVIWIGGIAFILYVAMPSSKQVLGKDSGRLMAEIAKKFTPIANISIVFIVIAGIAMTISNKEFSGWNFANTWTKVLIVKLFLVICMVAIHFYRGLVLAPKIMNSPSDRIKSTLQRLSLNLVKVNFGIGITVLLLSGILAVV